MCKKKAKYKEYKDLVEFEKKYNKRINDFLNSDPETRVVFLNADFGWGKTTFIKNNLKVSENLIYSPWLNKSENYIEEIYYSVTKKDKSFLSSITIFLSVILTIITILSDSIISILMELCKGNTYEYSIRNLKIIFNTNESLKTLLLSILLIITVVILILLFVIFCKPIPFVNFFKNGKGKYYENKVIKHIVKNIDKVLVIEDIDRTDDIEEILIVANKISDYIKQKKLKKYVLITGDYIRMIRRISEPNIYDNGQLNLSTYRNKGMFVVEKIISLRIDFSSIDERINNLLIENKIEQCLTKIENDEIIEFVKSKFLSVRFFIKFLEKYNEKIKNGNSLYHLLLQFFQEEKFFNIPDNIIKKSIYNVERFPTCINDIEIMLQKGTVLINDKLYSEIDTESLDEGNYSIIKMAFKKLFFEKDEVKLKIFKIFYLNERYPILAGDRKNINNDYVRIGEHLKPSGLKNNLDNFLLGHNNNEEAMYEGMLINKRSYFPAINTSNNFENYKITQVDINETVEVSNDDFIYAYIAAFFRKNKDEIENNYPEIKKIILELLNVN